MAESQELEAEAGSGTAEGKPVVAAKPARNKKKLALIAGAAGVLLLGGGGTAYALMGSNGSETAEASGHGGGEEGGEEAGPEAFVDLPAMTVNLRSADGTPRFLRVHLMLVPSSGDRQEEITQKLPLIIDAYQPFLRELRPEDLAGSAAAFRLKEEMLVRANQEVGAGAVADVLIQDLVQQ
jgi:flagellar FliL protein